MFSRIALSVLLFSGVVQAGKIQTKGDCSPAVVSNEGAVNINCYINDVSLESLVREGNAIKLIDALEAGVSAETILQGFVLGDVRKLSGVDFFKKVKITDLSRLLKELSKRININDQIYLGSDAYTTLFWLAADAQKKDVILTMARLGMAIHVNDHRHGGYHDRFVSQDFFPIIELIQNGVISIEDTEILEELFENSFVLPEFNVKDGERVAMSVRDSGSDAFFKKVDLLDKIISLLPKAKNRKSYDMANIPKLCSLASIADDFNWCERLRSVSSFYLSDDKTGTHYPYSIRLIGLLNIRSDYAIFLIHHTRNWGSIGLFFVPKKGTKYLMGLWNTKYSNSTPCWSEKLEGWDIDCWRLYTYEQDLFNKSKIVGTEGYPTFTAEDEKISW